MADSDINCLQLLLKNLSNPTSSEEKKNLLAQAIALLKKLELRALRNDRIQELGIAGKIAHDMRQPLEEIEGFATLLYNDIKEYQHLKFMAEKVIAGTKTLTRVIDEVLEYAKQSSSPPRVIKEEEKFHQMVAESPQMKKILNDVAKIAKSNASVFISGESGTGKEVIAHAIHFQSPRSTQPFIRVNCAAIPENLLESEFFGHEKGAFTNAINKRIGRFELANKGTLLLDEISEIPLSLQSKLLRAIQEQEFEPVGSTKSVKVDVRFISTSNRLMKEAVEKKIFREDLYFRLNVVPIYLPPLRERKEDIIPLATFFLEKTSKTLSDNAKQALLAYPWPGNIRELGNVIERACIMFEGVILEEEHLQLETPSSPSTPKTLADLEKKMILETLNSCNQNKTKTAAILGISIRTLRNKLVEYSPKQ